MNWKYACSGNDENNTAFNRIGLQTAKVLMLKIVKKYTFTILYNML